MVWRPGAGEGELKWWDCRGVAQAACSLHEAFGCGHHT